MLLGWRNDRFYSAMAMLNPAIIVRLYKHVPSIGNRVISRMAPIRDYAIVRLYKHVPSIGNRVISRMAPIRDFYGLLVNVGFGLPKGHFLGIIFWCSKVLKSNPH